MSLVSLDPFFETPAILGVNPQRLDDLRARAQQEVNEGLLPSVQIAVARHGKLALFETYGEADNNNLYCIFSATKAITSAASWLLVQQGLLDVNAKVSTFIPEFAPNGKEDITVKQVLLHTAGFPHAPFRVTDWPVKARRLERFSQWRLNWNAGTRFEYHASSSMWIIAELIERLSGQTYENFVRERISLSLGLEDLWVGMPEEHHDRIAQIKHVGDALTADDYKAMDIPVPATTEVTPEAILNFNNTQTRTIPVPGGGGITSAANLALFYQGLMGQLDEKPWTRETIETVTEPGTGNFIDPVTGVPVNRGLGIVVAGDKNRNHRGFGHTNSPSAFGHKGAGGQIGWYDRATGLSFAYITNGHDRNPIREGRRAISLSNKAAVCLDE